MTKPSPPAEPTWDDVLGAIGEEFWKLAPAEFAAAAHRDLVFGVTWQDLMAAVENGVARCYPSAEEAS